MRKEGMKELAILREIGQADPGDWPHGWQLFAAKVLEQREHSALLSTFRGQGPASPDVARLRSCAGP